MKETEREKELGGKADGIRGTARRLPGAIRCLWLAASQLPEAVSLRAMRFMGVLLLASMGVTLGLLLVQGRWREALPLHLCSVSALAAAYLAFTPRAWLMDYLWYLGMPGAALALLFPAPAVSRWQAAMTFTYALTHALIMFIPLCTVIRGMRPREGRSLGLLLGMQALAAAACIANAALGTDFLFLAAPPAATPLERVYRLGYPLYLLFLETLLCCMVMERLIRLVFPNKTEKQSCCE